MNFIKELIMLSLPLWIIAPFLVLAAIYIMIIEPLNKRIEERRKQRRREKRLVIHHHRQLPVSIMFESVSRKPDTAKQPPDSKGASPPGTTATE